MENLNIERDSTLEDKIDDLIEKTEETNKLIKAMRRDALIGGVLKVIIWIVISIVAYVTVVNYLTPLLQSITNTGTIDPTDINNLIDFYKAELGS